MNHYSPSSFTFPIKWDIKKESIFRLLDNYEWIERFFDSGELKLSCFNNFRQYPDEMQGDIQEGNATVVGKDNDGNHHLLVYESGLNAYVMSTTTQINDSVIKDFNAKCAIKINNPTIFGLEVAKKLPFVNSGLEGKCIYETSRVHYFDKEIEKYEFFTNRKFNNDSKSIQALNEQTSGYELFLKLDKYKHQNEYRLIWFSNEHIKDSITIKCPELIRFCEMIKF